MCNSFITNQLRRVKESASIGAFLLIKRLGRQYLLPAPAEVPNIVIALGDYVNRLLALCFIS
ncbi:MAG: hypothetical protein IPI60_13415 [Saprospiraceae bacterium]|nr:hypothetical protein [Saprospiraceae bacterium]